MVTSQSTNDKVFHIKTATTSSTITLDSTTLEESSPFFSANVSSERQDIHNGESNFDEPEHKASTRTLDLRSCVSQARRFEGLYVCCSIPPMPPPTEWPVANASVAQLFLARATIDAYEYYGVFRKWKEEVKPLGRPVPIPLVLLHNETTNQYEAAFLQRTKPHLEAARQRSQRLNFALECARKLVCGNILPVSSRYATSASPLGTSVEGGISVPARKRQPAQARRHAKRQRLPRVKTLG